MTVSELILKLSLLPQDKPVVTSIGKGKKLAPIADPIVVQATNDTRRDWYDKHIDTTAVEVVLLQERE